MEFVGRQFLSQGCQTPSSLISYQRLLVSDIVKIYDVLGWFSPGVVKAKILGEFGWLQFKASNLT